MVKNITSDAVRSWTESLAKENEKNQNHQHQSLNLLHSANIAGEQQIAGKEVEWRI